MRYLGVAGVIIGGGILTGCMLPYPESGLSFAPALRVGPGSPTYSLPTDAVLAFDDTTPGGSSAVDASFSYPFNVLETYEIVFTLPGTFTFAGFTALGPAGTAIATYAIPTQGMTIPLRALTHDSAFADLYQDSTYDPGVDVLIAYEGNGTFRVTLPNGGDDQPLSTTASFDAQSTFHLLAGILGNPSTAGNYDLQAAFKSIDPDTDGADDGVGTPPSTFDAIRSVAIACASAADCDDADACTTDACSAGVCSHSAPDPLARLDCALGQLTDTALCGPDPIVAGFERVVQRKVAAARKAISKLSAASTKASKRLLRRIDGALRVIGKKAAHSRKLTPACRETFGRMVDERAQLVQGLPPP